jgi:hypothetical protein
LLFVLDNLREQLRTIFESETELDMTHDQWFEPPLSLFRDRADEDVEADMSDDDDNSENSESMEEEL